MKRRSNVLKKKKDADVYDGKDEDGDNDDSSSC